MKFTLTHTLASQGPGLVAYEIQMFLGLLSAWGVNLETLEPSSRLPIHNARLEATLLHARILLGFFECPPGKRRLDDVLSADMGFPAENLQGCETLRSDPNKRLAHLTYTRTEFTDIEKKRWSSDLFGPLVEKCREFLDAEAPNDFVTKHASAKDQAIWNATKAHAANFKT